MQFSDDTKSVHLLHDAQDDNQQIKQFETSYLNAYAEPLELESIESINLRIIKVDANRCQLLTFMFKLFC